MQSWDHNVIPEKFSNMFFEEFTNLENRGSVEAFFMEPQKKFNSERSVSKFITRRATFLDRLSVALLFHINF